MKYIFVIILIFFYTSVNCQTLVNYTASTADIPNPSRGLYSHRETTADTSGNMVSPLTSTDVQNQRTNKNITLILRLYYLNQFKTSNISASYLTSIQNDLNIIRNAGAKVILRFAYNSSAVTHRHTQDASKAWVLTHIGQLKNIIQTNSDVILAIQSGFVGTWGEWFYTHSDFTLTAPVGTPNYPNRKAVTDSILNILPLGKMIQLRTPNFKYNAAMYGNGTSGTATALTAAQAFSGSIQSRIGHHNDCFLASPDDYGTYINVTDDKNYLEQDTKYTFNGGETCNNDVTYTNCTNAQAELARFHFTYLNNDYNSTVLVNNWQANGCYNTIKQKLGYRLELLNGTYTNVGSPGYRYNVDINLRNVGYASPLEKRLIKLILKNTSTLTEYAVTLTDVDNRFWLPGSNYNINTTVGIGSIPNGTYNLYIALKDTASALTNVANYSIQMANTGTWESATGYNLLKTFTVNSSTNPGTGIYSGSLWFGTLSVTPIKLVNFTSENNSGYGLLKFTIIENTNNATYIIEKSTDGNRFSQIGKINPQANSSGKVSYVYNDIEKLNNQITYYRLKLVEKDGGVTYSKIIVVYQDATKLSLINVYPTPAINTITIDINNAIKSEAELSLIDINGKMVLSQKIFLAEGFNSLKNINTSTLHSGMYLVTIKSKFQTLSYKLVKSN